MVKDNEMKKRLLDGVLTAIQHANNSQATLSKALGYKNPTAISHWVCRSGCIPMRKVLEIHALYGIPKDVLRPDFYKKND